MSSNDDWKGEHLIRGVKPTLEDRRENGNGIVSRMWNKKRRAQGAPSPSWKQHRSFVIGCGLSSAKRS